MSTSTMASGGITPRVRLLILKVASRCNLACSYCYIYQSGDEAWRERSVVMQDETFSAILRWMQRQGFGSPNDPVTLLFHGGEPMLVGPDRLDAWCFEVARRLGPNAAHFAIQTNGVLINDRWVEVFQRHSVSVGVSIDGPPRVHDQHRFNHRGRGSYSAVLAGVNRLRAAEVPWSVLAVINLDHDPLEIYRHLVWEVGATTLDFLLPDHTHETIGAVRAKYGPTPLADCLISVFDQWWAKDSIRVRVRILDAIVASVLRRRSHSGQFGNLPLGYLVIETDGAVEGLDVLRICKPEMPKTGITVQSDEPLAAVLHPFHRHAIFEGLPLPTGCRQCSEAATCGGGWLPHRYSDRDGFDNPSAWCADLFKLFGHIRSQLGITAVPSQPPRALAGDPPSLH